MNFSFLMLLTILCAFAGVIWLQFFLSKKQSKWCGLILPAISLLYALMMVLSLAAYENVQLKSTTITEDGTVIEENIHTGQKSKPLSAQTALNVVIVFAVSNIPTVIFLGIYASCREKRKQKNLLEKMDIMDL